MKGVRAVIDAFREIINTVLGLLFPLGTSKTHSHTTYTGKKNPLHTLEAAYKPDDNFRLPENQA